MRSREKLEIATLGNSSWLPYAPQRVKGLDDEDVRLLFVLFCVLFVCKCVLPLGDNPIAVNKYIIIIIIIIIWGNKPIRPSPGILSPEF
jgi:hypothetical protein